MADSINSSSVEYLYHTHTADCVESTNAYINVIANNGTVCTYIRQYDNANYPKYPQSQPIHNDYIVNGGENYPQGYYALIGKIYFCNKGSMESINNDNLTGQEDTSIIEGATIVFNS